MRIVCGKKIFKVVFSCAVGLELKFVAEPGYFLLMSDILVRINGHDIVGYFINQSKFYLKSVHFITVQHKLPRAFQTDMHNKIS